MPSVPGMCAYSQLKCAATNKERCTPHPNGYNGAVGLSEDYARRSRAELDTDEPTIDGIQTLLLLSLAVTAAGNGKKSYMLLSKNTMTTTI